MSSFPLQPREASSAGTSYGEVAVAADRAGHTRVSQHCRARSTAERKAQPRRLSPCTVLARRGRAVPLRNRRNARFGSVCLNHLEKRWNLPWSKLLIYLTLSSNWPGTGIVLGYTAVNSVLKWSK